MKKTIQFRPVGVSAPDNIENFKKIVMGGVEIKHIPFTAPNGMEYPKCLRIIQNGKTVGSVKESIDPRSEMETVHYLLREGIPFQSSVTYIQLSEEDNLKLGMGVFQKGEPVSAVISLEFTPPIFEVIKSYNEDQEIRFYPDDHKYSLHNQFDSSVGDILKGCTTTISQFYEGFDSSAIAKRCETKWKTSAEKIQAMWSDNGDVASGFGTACHAIVEMLHNHWETGLSILRNSDKEENPCLPKHPIMKSIAEGYIELFKTHTGVRKVCPEVLVSDVKNGLCGLVDVLIENQDGTVSLKDVKINFEPENKKVRFYEPFKKLPANNIGKYMLQLNVYREMLENSGRTVRDMEIYLLQKEWSKIQIPRIDVLKHI